MGKREEERGRVSVCQ